MKASGFANNNLRNAEVIEAMGMLGNLRRRWATYHHRSCWSASPWRRTAQD
jgi:ABC-type protease/lipase transport system fused ATPase/permease subunit